MLEEMPSMKLGKRAPKHDKLVPMLAKYTAKLPPPPEHADWSDGLAVWGMMCNDTIGDCTCAAVGHAIQTWTKNAGSEKTIPDSAVVALYSAVSGYSASDPSTDAGAVEIDVLKHWLKTPVNGHPLDGIVALQPKDIRDVKDAIWLFGGIYIGLALPLSAQGADVWVVPAEGLKGNGEPGSWGGHAVYVISYDTRGLTCITWGRLQRMSWNFWWAYCDESYGLLSKDWIESNWQKGLSPSGFDYQSLAGDLNVLRHAA